MSLLRQLFYSRPINTAVRTCIGPFRRSVPAKWHFPVNGVVRIPLEDGKAIRMLVNPTSFQGKRFFWDGVEGFEPAVHALFKLLVKEARTFLDVGANLGLYSLLANAYQPSIHVMTFEPLPAAFGYLKRNLALNGLEKIDAFPLALSDSNGEATFHGPFNAKFGYLKAHLGGTGSLDAGASDVNKHRVAVPTSRLDDLLSGVDHPPIDLIKLDTEGTEHSVIDGAMETIKQHRPLIYCEVLRDRIESALDNRLGKLDYSIHAITPEGLHKISTLQHDRLEVNDYLFCPSERTASLPEGRLT